MSAEKIIAHTEWLLSKTIAIGTGCPVAIGETYTTTKSGVTGVVREVVANPTGTWRVRLETADGSDRWTTAG
jgi:hypothetical protein